MTGLGLTTFLAVVVALLVDKALPDDKRRVDDKAAKRFARVRDFMVVSAVWSLSQMQIERLCARKYGTSCRDDIELIDFDDEDGRLPHAHRIDESEKQGREMDLFATGIIECYTFIVWF